MCSSDLAGVIHPIQRGGALHIAPGAQADGQLHQQHDGDQQAQRHVARHLALQFLEMIATRRALLLESAVVFLILFEIVMGLYELAHR